MKKGTIKRLVAVVALCVATISSLGTAAHAGEITGNGKDTPIRSYTARSICAFSGLNDHTGFFEGKTQNFGQMPKAVKDEARAQGWSPGYSCRGNLEFDD
jgi:hypothetical protein